MFSSLLCFIFSFRTLQWDQPLQLEIESDGCAGTKNEIRYIEHVQVLLSIDYSRRGDLTIFLTSPMGTRSCLLPIRSEDSSDEGFRKWPFMTTHAWGEDPRGNWLLEIKDGGESRRNTGFLKDWQLLIHGTREKPTHQNITHPETPTHQKAVPDDVKKVEKSSVQITQITYSFAGGGGSQVASQTPYPAHAAESQYSAPTTSDLQAQGVQQVSTFQQPSPSPVNLVDYTVSQQQQQQQQQIQTQQAFPYSGANNANKYEDLSTRTSIPVYPNTNSNSYPNYASLQPPSSMGYEQQNAAMRSSGYVQPYSADTTANGNLWDFFGRLNGRRSAEESVFYGPAAAELPAPDYTEWNDSSNSFVQLLRRLEKLNRGYD